VGQVFTVRANIDGKKDGQNMIEEFAGFGIFLVSRIGEMESAHPLFRILKSQPATSRHKIMLLKQSFFTRNILLFNIHPSLESRVFFSNLINQYPQRSKLDKDQQPHFSKG
jgi:hypothetical protein